MFERPQQYATRLIASVALRVKIVHSGSHRSQAAALLQHLTRLRVQDARGGLRPQAGTVYLAPPDRHLELRGGRLHLTHAARVNYSRPSIDLLFASVAAEAGPRAIVAVLSGTGSDGTAGVAAVKARGGLALAEDASTARFPGMPAAAGRMGLLDAVLPVRQMPAFLMRPVLVDKSENRVETLGQRLRKEGSRLGQCQSTPLQFRLRIPVQILLPDPHQGHMRPE